MSAGGQAPRMLVIRECVEGGRERNDVEVEVEAEAEAEAERRDAKSKVKSKLKLSRRKATRITTRRGRNCNGGPSGRDGGQKAAGEEGKGAHSPVHKLELGCDDELRGMKGNGDKKREPREVDDDGRDVAGDGAEGGDSRGSQRRTRTGRRWSRHQLRLSLEKTKLPGFGASKGIETVGELGWRGWLIRIHPQQSGPQQPSSPAAPRTPPGPSAGGRAVSEWVGRGGTGACAWLGPWRPGYWGPLFCCWGLTGARAPKHFWGTPPKKKKKKTAEKAVVSCELPATRYSPMYRYLLSAARKTPSAVEDQVDQGDTRHSTLDHHQYPAENRSDRYTLHAAQFAPALPLRRRLAPRICFGLLMFLYFLLFGFPGARRRALASNQSWLSWGVWVTSGNAVEGWGKLARSLAPHYSGSLCDSCAAAPRPSFWETIGTGERPKLGLGLRGSMAPGVYCTPMALG